jgi:hypothetical protein
MMIDKLWCVFLNDRHKLAYDLQAICATEEQAQAIALKQREDITRYVSQDWIVVRENSHWYNRVDTGVFQRVSQVTPNQLRGEDESDPLEVREECLRLMREFPPTGEVVHHGDSYVEPTE